MGGGVRGEAGARWRGRERRGRCVQYKHMGLRLRWVVGFWGPGGGTGGEGEGGAQFFCAVEIDCRRSLCVVCETRGAACPNPARRLLATAASSFEASD